MIWKKFVLLGVAAFGFSSAVDAASQLVIAQQPRASASVDFAIVIPTVASLQLTQAGRADARELKVTRRTSQTAAVNAQAAANAGKIHLGVAHEAAERSSAELRGYSSNASQSSGAMHRVVYTLALP